MGNEKQVPNPITVNRIFEHPPGTISFYSDFTQVISTGHEIIIQFYESIPGLPTSGGQIEKVTTRLRATVTLSVPHANNLGKNLMEKALEIKK